MGSVDDIIRPMYHAHITWDNELIRAAEQQADFGDLRLAVDLCERMLGDDQIQLGLSKRIQGLLKFEVDFEKGKRGGNRPVKALDAGEDYCKMLPESESSEIKRWGLLLGLSPARLAWFDDPATGRHIPRVISWPTHGMTYRDGRFSVLTSNEGAKEVICPGDGKWALYTPWGRHRPWARGLWRGLSRWWLLKQLAMADFSEAGAEKPKRAISDQSTPDGAGQGLTKAQRKALAEEIADMAERGVIVLPRGFVMNMVEQSATSYQQYEAQIRLANEAIITSILWHNLGTLVDGGSFAAASTAVGVELGALQYDAEYGATWEHDEVIVHWALVNWGTIDAAPWPTRVVELPKDPQAEATSAAALSTAADAIVKLVGLGADKAKLLERFGIEAAETPEVAPVTFTRDDMDFGIVTVNEVRAARGLPASPGGNGRPVPSAALVTPAQPPAGPPSPFGLTALSLPGQPPPKPHTLESRRAGWLASQLATDQAVDTGVAQASDAIAPLRAAIVERLSKAGGYDEARKELAHIMKTSDVTPHAEILWRAMVLAHLQGADGATS